MLHIKLFAEIIAYQEPERNDCHKGSRHLFSLAKNVWGRHCDVFFGEGAGLLFVAQSDDKHNLVQRFKSRAGTQISA